MSVINNWPAVPNRLAIACEYLQYEGESGVSRNTFKRQLSPGVGFVDPEDLPEKSIAVSVLNEMEAFGLAVMTDSGNIRLAPSLPNKKMNFEQWHSWLIPWFTERLSEINQADQLQQQGVPLAIAWLLCQDSRKPIRTSGAHADLLVQQFGDIHGLGVNIDNDSRFQNLIYWARYMGFAEGIRLKSATTLDYVIPDPTRAIRRILPVIFASESEIPIHLFIESLSNALPVLEGGSVRQQVETKMNVTYQRSTQHFSQATILALRRLDYAGVIKLESESDAAHWILDDGDVTRRVSRVVFNGAKQ